MNFSNGVNLQFIRSELVRLEDSIIFALIERAQFSLNPEVYQPGGVEGNLMLLIAPALVLSLSWIFDGYLMDI